MEFILNKTLGINGIDRISFKKIIEILGKPSKIKLELGKVIIKFLITSIILESIQALMILLI